MVFHVRMIPVSLTTTERMKMDACTEPTMICAWMTISARMIFAHHLMKQQTAKAAPTKPLIPAVTMDLHARTISVPQEQLAPMQQTVARTLPMTHYAMMVLIVLLIHASLRTVKD